MNASPSETRQSARAVQFVCFKLLLIAILACYAIDIPRLFVDALDLPLIPRLGSTPPYFVVLLVPALIGLATICRARSRLADFPSLALLVGTLLVFLLYELAVSDRGGSEFDVVFQLVFAFLGAAFVSLYVQVFGTVRELAEGLIAVAAGYVALHLSLLVLLSFWEVPLIAVHEVQSRNSVSIIAVATLVLAHLFRIDWRLQLLLLLLCAGQSWLNEARGALVMLVVVGGLRLTTALLPRRIGAAVAFGLLLASVVLFLLAFPIVESLRPGFMELKPSGYSRTRTNYDLLLMLLDNGLLGLGNQAVIAYRIVGSYTHSFTFILLFAYGIVGLLLFLLLFWAIWREAGAPPQALAQAPLAFAVVVVSGLFLNDLLAITVIIFTLVAYGAATGETLGGKAPRTAGSLGIAGLMSSLLR